MRISIPSSARPRQLTLAQLFLWTTAVAALMAYAQVMPLGTLLYDRSFASQAFALLFGALGGIGVAGLIWQIPRLLRGEAAQLAPGELLLMACGAIIVIDCYTLAWAATRFPPMSLEFYRAYIPLYSALAVPLFLAVGAVSRGGLAWQLALASLAIPYAAWGLIVYLDVECGGRSYLWYGERSAAGYLLLLSPLLPAILFAVALIIDFRRPRSAGHWLGIILMLIIAAQSLYYVGWHRMLGLLAP